MAILRKEKRYSFTVIDNGIFHNYNLSFKAKGLLCQMLSLPDGWEFSAEGLATLSTDGRSAVTSALTELEEQGYLRREQIRNEGKIAGVEYVISEVPFVEKPIAENPISGNPISENHEQLNTNISNTNSLRTKDITIEFEKLWELYPRKHGKAKAFNYYKRARMSGTTYEEVESGILAYKAYLEAEQTDAQYIKMGSTFFSQKAWQDDWTPRMHSTGNPWLDMLNSGDY